jgi:hypothetical protein
VTIDDRKRTADKFRWLDQVGADGSLTPLCFRLAYAIVTYINRTTGDAWPRQEILALECHVTDRAIRSALTLLSDRKHLHITPGGARRGDTSRYRPIVQGTSETRNVASTFQRRKAEASFHDNSAKGGSTLPERRKPASGKGGSQLPTIPLKETIDESIEGKSLMIASQDFNEFWSIYPKRVDKLKAEKIYTTIIKTKRATVAELVEGARRYAAAKAGTERRFIKHPSSWLNAGGWLDEPEPTITKPTSRADSAIAGMARFLNQEQ